MDVYGLDGKVARSITLPSVFSGEFRQDLVRRALLAEQSLNYQPQGHSVVAGFQTTAVYIGSYDASYRRGRHMGQAIRPRQKLGGGAQGDVRRIPSAVKGHRAHPHKIERIIEEQINNKEYAKALRSAIGGCSHAEFIKQRHTYDGNTFPIIVDDKLEGIAKTKDLIVILKALGISKDLERSHKPKLRRGLKRSAKSRHFRNSVLIVSKSADKISKAGRNIPGVDVTSINDLTVQRLAPGGTPRLTIWTESAATSVESAITAQSVRTRR
ncbi:MAG: 50S ribosomal protein L4 [Candidatus Micrarchaeota archaeon]|nr:50S ribosomal protein L4 [Candidatus Micrarchaeota archaeon]MDE1833986.1 50S ribosomal protein L4 [Candidatus Micrarchaeota archaeon]MDE1858963.1 50S ribosomal protein L4 [Candidatus Micrarchaeota archaeon]